MADILSTISLMSFIAAGVMLVLAIAIFFVLKIPMVMGDLSGRNARKSIEKMRQNNEKTGKKVYAPSDVNISRGKLTETIKKENAEFISLNEETGLLNENFRSSYVEDETRLLGDSTEVLGSGNETVQLNGSNIEIRNRVSSIVFEYIDNIMLTDTEEVIY